MHAVANQRQIRYALTLDPFARHLVVRFWLCFVESTQIWSSEVWVEKQSWRFLCSWLLVNDVKEEKWEAGSRLFLCSRSPCAFSGQQDQTRRTRPEGPDQKNQTSRTRPGPCRPGFSAGVWRPGRVALLCLWPSWSELELVSVVCVVCLMCTVGQLVSNTRKTVYICSNL